MTAFLVHFGNSAAELAVRAGDVTSALKCLEYRGPHGASSVAIDGVRLSAANRFTDRRNTLIQPLVRNDPPVALVFDGRLDAQEDLARTLAVKNAPRDLSDVELVVACYARYQDKFLSQLRGDFALVLYDSRSRTLYAGRDFFGSRIVFWTETCDGLYLSNDLPAIRSVPRVDDTLDELQIADYLTHGQLGTFDKVRTPFRGIKTLAPANCLIATGKTRKLFRYLNFNDYLSARGTLSPGEATEAFNAVIAAAVAERLNVERALIPLSGGLDSTTIAAAAVEACRSGRARSELKVYTGLGSQDDEEASYAQSAATHLGLHVNFFTPDDEALLAPPQPSWYPSTQFYVPSPEGVVERLHATSDIVLYGSAADSALHPDATTILRLIRTHGFTHAHHAWKSLREQGRSISFGSGLFKKERGNRQLGAQHQPYSSGLPSWLDRDFVKDHALESRHADATNWRPPDQLHSDHPSAQICLQWGNWFCGSFSVGMVETPPEWSDPFLDFRVLAVIFSLPNEPWLHRKYLMRQAGRGRLPNDVLTRPKTPAGKYLSERIAQLDRSLINDWKISPDLRRFINRADIPPIDIRVESSNTYLNFRPMMLQRWYSRLKDW